MTLAAEGKFDGAVWCPTIGLSNCCFFAPETRVSLIRMALLAMARRTSPFEAARPALTKAARTPKSGLQLGAGNLTVGRMAPSPPCSKRGARGRAGLVGRAAAMDEGRRFGGENFLRLVDFGVLERGKAVDLAERHDGEQFRNRTTSASSVLRQYCQYS